MTPAQIRCVLFDLEGTIVPLEFVHKVLFPYAVEKLAGYLRTDDAQEHGFAWLAALRAEAARGLWPQGAPLLPEPDGHENPNQAQAELVGALPLLQWLTAQDIKSPVLKSIQGRIWRSGYEDGTLRGELFGGVAEGLRQLAGAGYRLAIYSSGSVEAQKLLLTHSTDGDLSGLMAGWYDTAMGGKTDAGSYLRIADEQGLPPEAVLFATDHTGEARAAAEAGMKVALSLRGVTSPGQVADLNPPPVLVSEDITAEILQYIG